MFGRSFLFLDDMFSAVPVGLPVGIVKAVDADALAGGNVDELIFSQVNAAMRRARFIRGEEGGW